MQNLTEMTERIESLMCDHELVATDFDRIRQRDVHRCKCGTQHPAFDGGRWSTHRRHVAQVIAADLVERGPSTTAG